MASLRKLKKRLNKWERYEQKYRKLVGPNYRNTSRSLAKLRMRHSDRYKFQKICCHLKMKGFLQRAGLLHEIYRGSEGLGTLP